MRRRRKTRDGVVPIQRRADDQGHVGCPGDAAGGRVRHRPGQPEVEGIAEGGKAALRRDRGEEAGADPAAEVDRQGDGAAERLPRARAARPGAGCRPAALPPRAAPRVPVCGRVRRRQVIAAGGRALAAEPGRQVAVGPAGVVAVPSWLTGTASTAGRPELAPPAPRPARIPQVGRAGHQPVGCSRRRGPGALVDVLAARRRDMVRLGGDDQDRGTSAYCGRQGAECLRNPWPHRHGGHAYRPAPSVPPPCCR